MPNPDGDNLFYSFSQFFLWQFHFVSLPIVFGQWMADDETYAQHLKCVSHSLIGGIDFYVFIHLCMSTYSPNYLI